ncbi:MAG: DUF4286 family protein [Tannerella sp.]|jgi:hypothetical protein|nr:DUF4286 family protein [Tannerella sp.]
MVTFYTTFHLSNENYPKGLDYLKTVYVPAAMRSGKLRNPRIQKVVDDNEAVNGVSLSVQCSADDRQTLEEWMRGDGTWIHLNITDRFKDEIALFSTILEEIEL